ncbi:hypothetical protein IO99_12835 [Clostridium sulfidigenes]|uniref:Uncharacterized protein n=1 Tax=Clostridium sulfidigenes TaxID=318464 RepID=A0A084JA02_9CLOT|nr:hypothetical protein [Clostridium sulfidigenes]KEZ85786.1 hypothetical protein IO99_12835 [Clostridium sulfidigenes]HBA05091.1 hypothetical protein [Clostridium sp.]
MENKMENKNVVALGKDMYKVEDGKVVITSEELANAIQNEGLDLFVDEEAAAQQANSFCCW